MNEKLAALVEPNNEVNKDVFVPRKKIFFLPIDPYDKMESLQPVRLLSHVSLFDGDRR